MTAFIFHGVGGNSQENWFPWMKTELEKQGIKTVVPDFPYARTPTLKNWMKYFTKDHPLSGDDILIGHSLGAAFALRLLEQSDTKICATFLVSPVWKPPANIFAPLIATFTKPPYDWKKILEHAGTIHILHGDDDPYLSTDYVRELGNHLHCDPLLIPNGGHLNAPAGYTEFPLLKQSIILAATR